MEAPAHKQNVIVVGAWNRRLFTPHWLQQEFSGEADVTLEMAVGNPALPLRLSYDDLRLEVSNDRLTVSSSQTSDDAIQKVQELASGVLERLRHTPVTGVGVNFQWNEPEPDASLLAVFDLSDNQDLADAGVAVAATTLSRNTTWGDRVLNLKLNLTPDGVVEYHMNFHNDVTSTAAAKEVVDGGLVALRQQAWPLLATVYSLEE